jgi:hypothetical protein
MLRIQHPRARRLAGARAPLQVLADPSTGVRYSDGFHDEDDVSVTGVYGETGRRSVVGAELRRRRAMTNVRFDAIAGPHSSRWVACGGHGFAASALIHHSTVGGGGGVGGIAITTTTRRRRAFAATFASSAAPPPPPTATTTTTTTPESTPSAAASSASTTKAVDAAASAPANDVAAAGEGKERKEDIEVDLHALDRAKAEINRLHREREIKQMVSSWAKVVNAWESFKALGPYTVAGLALSTHPRGCQIAIAVGYTSILAVVR